MLTTTTASASHGNEVRLGPQAGVRNDWSLMLVEVFRMSFLTWETGCVGISEE
jgi:hypothetical protein